MVKLWTECSTSRMNSVFLYPQTSKTVSTRAPNSSQSKHSSWYHHCTCSFSMATSITPPKWQPIYESIRTCPVGLKIKWWISWISSLMTWILSINTLKIQTTQCQLEYIISTSVLPASTSMLDVSSSSSAVVV